MSDLLTDLKKKQHKKKRGAGLRAFIAAQDQIEEALKQGFNKKEIWESLKAKNRMPIGYPQFSEHVRKHLQDPAKRPLFTPKKGGGRTAPDSPPEAETETSKDSAQSEPKNFTHSAEPNKDDLIG